MTEPADDDAVLEQVLSDGPVPVIARWVKTTKTALRDAKRLQEIIDKANPAGK